MSIRDGQPIGDTVSIQLFTAQRMEELTNKLYYFDWFYMYSDDGEVYRRGRMGYEKMRVEFQKLNLDRGIREQILAEVTKRQQKILKPGQADYLYEQIKYFFEIVEKDNENRN